MPPRVRRGRRERARSLSHPQPAVTKGAFTTGFSAREVAGLLGLTLPQVMAYVRAGVVGPKAGPRGEHRFTLPDVVILRTAKGLADHIPAGKLRRALRRLKEQLPPGRPLSAVRITVQGDEIVVRDGPTTWNPVSGQRVLDFEVSELASKVAPLVRKAAKEAHEVPDDLGPDDWFELGYQMELSEPDQARDAYRRTLELDPEHVAARVNLGRLLHERKQFKLAEVHYRLALAVDPQNATAYFNLGVALEDLGRMEEAASVYESAVEHEPGHADAHFNLAQLYERLGKKALAIRHLKAYQSIRPVG
jgi:tetratricopeptide (TPR) repeat protein